MALFLYSIALFVVYTPYASAGEDSGDLLHDKKKIEKKIVKEEKKLQEAKKTLTTVQHSLSETAQRVSRTEDQLNRIAREVQQREKEIKDLTARLTFQRTVLKSILRELYRIEREGVVTQFLTRDSGHFFAMDRDRMITVRDRVMDEVKKIEKSKTQIEVAKAKLAQQKEKQRELLAQQKREQQILAVTRNEFAQRVQKHAATIAELRRELSEVKNRLARLLDKVIDTDDIIKAAKIASKATGVRKDFILGELVVETKLGSYTGGCTYKKAHMRDADKEALKKIAKELGRNYKKLKLSCYPGYGHGGAMGVAQFMPTTWLGYKDRIASATGHNPPDPWNLVDGVMAMALYLKNKGADHKSGEFEAAKRYYCGSPASPFWNTKCNSYAKKVIYWADNYERLIK